MVGSLVTEVVWNEWVSEGDSGVQVGRGEACGWNMSRHVPPEGSVHRPKDASRSLVTMSCVSGFLSLCFSVRTEFSVRFNRGTSEGDGTSDFWHSQRSHKSYTIHWTRPERNIVINKKVSQKGSPGINIRLMN